MSTAWTRRALLGTVLTGTLALSLAVPAAAQDSSPLAEKVSNGETISVGIANEAPYGFVDSSGELAGEAPSVLEHILTEMGASGMDAVVTEFGSLIPGLQAGRFDIIAAGMFITPPRCEQIVFSEPTYGIGQAFLIQEGNPKDLHNYDDIANSDATLAVMAGAIEGDYARDSGVSLGQLLVVPDKAAGTAAVEAGRADAFALTSLAIREIVAARGDGSGLAMTDAFSEIAGENVKGHGGFGFREEDAAFVDQFNQQLTEFIGSEEHLAMVEPFGFSEDELPERARAELCPDAY